MTESKPTPPVRNSASANVMLKFILLKGLKVRDLAVSNPGVPKKQSASGTGASEREKHWKPTLGRKRSELQRIKLEICGKTEPERR